MDNFYICFYEVLTTRFLSQIQLHSSVHARYKAQILPQYNNQLSVYTYIINYKSKLVITINLLHLKMGCHMTSVYADQVKGIIGYSDQIQIDLSRRKYQVPYKFLKYKTKKHLSAMNQSIESIYGLAQSYCQGFLFSTIIQKREYLLYNNGRFIIKTQKNDMIQMKQGLASAKQVILAHEDKVCVMDVCQNMCIVGVSGGKVILWDIKFDSIKIQINLPQPSLSFSSISVGKKKIFVTDNSSPHNHTTKLLSSSMINSPHPTLRGVRFQQNHHVTVCAQGLWFIRYTMPTQNLEITKGMFTQFPKTSQSSIININDKFLITGGVDGYLYVWSQLYECIKVIRCFDEVQEITAMGYNAQAKVLIVGSIRGKVKCFSFQVKERFKDGKQQTQKYQEVECSFVEAFEQQSGVQNIAFSKQEKLLYFKLSHRGRMMSHLLPSNQPYSNKLKLFNNTEFMRFSRKGECIFTQPTNSHNKPEYHLNNIYPSQNPNQFNFDILKFEQSRKWWTVKQKKLIRTKQLNQNYLTLYTYCDRFECLAYVNNERKVAVSFHLKSNDVINIENQPTSKNCQLQQAENGVIEVFQIDVSVQIIGLNYLSLNLREDICTFLFISLEEKVHVYEVRNKRQYNLNTSTAFKRGQFNKFQIRINKDQKSQNTDLQTFQVYFDEQLNIWKCYEQSDKGLDNTKQREQEQELKNVHTALVKQQFSFDKSRITIGGSSIITWKQKI